MNVQKKIKNMISTKYMFTISSNRRIKNIVLNFEAEDFRHASGLHHVDDISIENNPGKLIEYILDGKLTDEMLEKSNKYKLTSYEGGSVRERVAEFCFLEEYLDTSDFIRIYKMQDFGSLIKADFFIEATKIERNTTVYIFIRKRVENDNFVIVSFFKKAVVYKGTAAYWMIKKKTVGDSEVELYRNQNYRE